MVDRAVLEFDQRIELLPGELLQSDALARAHRPLHDLVVNPFVVQRFLHAPAWAGLPRRRAPMERDRHAVDDRQPRGPRLCPQIEPAWMRSPHYSRRTAE